MAIQALVGDEEVITGFVCACVCVGVCGGGWMEKLKKREEEACKKQYPPGILYADI